MCSITSQRRRNRLGHHAWQLNTNPDPPSLSAHATISRRTALRIPCKRTTRSRSQISIEARTITTPTDSLRQHGAQRACRSMQCTFFAISLRRPYAITDLAVLRRPRAARDYHRSLVRPRTKFSHPVKCKILKPKTRAGNKYSFCFDADLCL